MRATNNRVGVEMAGEYVGYPIFQIPRDLIPADYKNDKSSLTPLVCLPLYHV